MLKFLSKWGICLLLFLATVLSYQTRQTRSILAPSLQKQMHLSILLANEVTDGAKLRRVVDLARQTQLLLCVDNLKIVKELARLVADRTTQLGVLVDLDVGAHRCGVPPGEAAADLARAVVQSGLHFRGLMGYEGGSVRKLPSPEREQAAAAAMRSLTETAAAIRDSGIPVEIVSGGGTGTYSISGRFPGVTEIQAGSYLLMDTDYRQCCTDFGLTLTVLASVVSKTPGDRIVVDAGLKSLSCEHGLPAWKNWEKLSVRKFTAEHGIWGLADAAVPLEVGDKIEIWVPYADASVNLHRRIRGIRDGRVEEVFRVEG